MQKSRCFLLEGVRKMKKINWKVIAVLTVLCILGGAYTLAFADTSAVLVKPGDNISNGQTVVRIAAN